MTAKKTTKRPSAGNRQANGQFGKGNTQGNRWAKGVSGNPAGTSKAQTLSVAYRNKLKEPWPGDPSMTYADVVAETLAKAAASGDVGAAKELADRTEGRAPQAVTLTVNEGREMLENAAQ